MIHKCSKTFPNLQRTSIIHSAFRTCCKYLHISKTFSPCSKILRAYICTKFSASTNVQNSLRLYVYKTLCAYIYTKHFTSTYVQNYVRLHMYKTLCAYIYIYIYIYMGFFLCDRKQYEFWTPTIFRTKKFETNPSVQFESSILKKKNSKIGMISGHPV